MDKTLKLTGERCIPEYMGGKIKTLQAHYTRYVLALMYCRNKTVLDASSGSGFGTSILRDVCKSILGVDVSQEAIEYSVGKYGENFLKCDLDVDWPKDEFGKNLFFDIVVSFETIEHLTNQDYFIKNVKENSNGFIFSLPINMPSEFHKTVFTVESAKELMEKHYGKDNINWISQYGMNTKVGISNRAKYLIGFVQS